jgi:uncharacterized protein (DUF2252 family)
VRGNTVRFYDWLRSPAVKGSVPVGPEIWICGDCHIGNLGPVADVDGNIAIQIRDLDQTVIGNPAHDLLRLGLSLAMSARSSDLPGITTALMLEELIVSYIAGLNGREERSDSEANDPLGKVIRQAGQRRWRHLAEERIEDVKPNIPLGSRFWAMTPDERKAMRHFFEDKDHEEISRCVQGKEGETSIEMLDAAYWVKGCSSLGRLRYAVLVRLGRKKDKEYRLLDMKEATQAAAPCARNAAIPANDAERVVCGARNLSPFLGERMVSGTFSGKQVVVRELRPEDLKFELEDLTQEEAIASARMMAGVVGRAHGRQMTRAQRTSWSKELKARNAPGLDAPRWLWSGVIDLVGLHEAAYLDHCRRYAVGELNGSRS